ncbi:MAG TPA: choice-of-anchor tandem repeat GloVer-containing protein [Candidatus Cybelea sp.]
MRTFAQSALTVSLAAGLLGGCGGSQPLISAPSAVPQSREIAPTRILAHHSAPGSSYQVLYSFAGSPDGAFSVAGLIYLDGTLYGTTSEGGTAGLGTIFSLGTSGKEQVLHSFQGTGAGDGARPEANLIDVNGVLYGTSAKGGASDHGTVFSISTTGAERVLYKFRDRSDGYRPVGGLIDVNGTLYGTTRDGGDGSACKGGCGTAFSISTSGDEHVLHSFGSGSDGKNPGAGLIEVGRRLYGVTSVGGSHGYGTVFSISTTGKEKVLYSFGPLPDGRLPEAGLIDVDGTLYGTTYAGGTYDSCGSCNSGGTVFSISKSGREHVLHSFGGSDGYWPLASLIDVNGTLYGTTSGSIASGCGRSCGTVFSITPGGTETVLHNFTGSPDGRWPAANLTNVNGTLYGTTQLGGDSNSYRCPAGCGTVFSLTP